MGFIDTIYEKLDEVGARPLLIEVRGTELVPTTGAQLLELVAHARGFVADRGVKPADRVALVAHNGVRWSAADVAILGNGAICVPMYDRQAPSELASMLEQCEARLVLVDRPELKAALEAAWPRHCEIALFDDVFAHAKGDLKPVPRAPHDRVTMIYTSGTSGEPKGVLYTVANVDFMLARTVERLDGMLAPRPEGHRVFHYLPFCFAGSRIQLWSQLARGNPLMISTDLNDLVREMGTAAPNYFLNVPALLERIRTGVTNKLVERGGVARALFDAGLRAAEAERQGKAGLVDVLALALARRVVFPQVKQQIGKNLEFLICGSAPLSEHTQRWFQTIGIPVYQVYGLTETTAIVTMDKKGEVEPGYVGPAIDGVELRLDPEGQLLVRGPNVFPEYWKRPEATAKAIEDQWFHTGDQAELDARGNLKIIGRVKDILVPESGHNVAPVPIEERLVALCEGALQAMVVGHARPFLSVIVTGPVQAAALERALEKLNAELPHYRRLRKSFLAPEPFTIENGLLTANQKLKRSAVEQRHEQAIKAMYA